MRGKWLLLSGCTILLAVAAGTLSVLRPPARTPPPAKVTAAAAVGPEVLLPGKIEAQHLQPVGAPVEGVIQNFLVDVGQEVFEGQPLVQLQNEEFASSRNDAQHELERAQTRVSNLESALIAARLDASRADAEALRSRLELGRLEKVYQRQQMLVREGATPRLVFDKAEHNYQSVQADYNSYSDLAHRAQDRQATLQQEIEAARRQVQDRQTALESAQAQLESAEVRSPVTGVVVARRGQVGDEVDPSLKDLVQIAVDLSQLRIVVEPSAPVLQKLRAGQTATVIIAEAASEPMRGLVREIKDGHVTVEFTNSSPAVKPGLAAQVQLKLS